MITSNLTYIMEREGFSINLLHEKTGVSRNTISRARSSKTIRFCSLDTLEKLAAALNCSPKQLYGYESGKCIIIEEKKK